MPLFVISGNDLKGVRALGAGSPPDGYYPAIIEKIEPSQNKPGSYGLTVRFQTGFTSLYWLNMPAQLQPGQTVDMLSKEDKRKHNGRLAAFRAVLESLGYDATVLDNPNSRIDESWMVYDAQRNPRNVFVEWVDGVGDEYGDVQAFLRREDYEARIASGVKPHARPRPQQAGGGQAAGWAPGSSPGGTAPAPQGAQGSWAPQGQPPVQQGAPVQQGGWAPQGAPVQQGAPGQQGGWAPQGQPPVQNGQAAPQQAGGGWGGNFPPAPSAPR